MSLVLAACATALAGAGAPGSSSPGDARATWDGKTLVLQTARVRHVLATDGGRLVRTAWVDRTTGRDLLAGRALPEFAVTINGADCSSAEPGWQVGAPTTHRSKDGALTVTLALQRTGIEVQRVFVLYPKLSLVRSWSRIRRTGPAEVELREPPISEVSLAGADDLHWMTGAEPWGDSWRMKVHPLAQGARVFDSYDPPTQSAPAGDGVDTCIRLNDRQVWPETGWSHTAHSFDVKPHSLRLRVHVGDRISFVVARGANMTCDTTEWDPTVQYTGGEAFKASLGFGPAQGTWQYVYETDGGVPAEMVYDGSPGPYGKRWRCRMGVVEPFISATEMHPDPEGRAVRVWVAPRDGEVQVTGQVRNSGNAGPQPYGHRMGSQAYAPWFALQSATGHSAYMGFDCIAHWRAVLDPAASQVTVRLAGYHKRLGPGETVTTPTSFTGLFSGDLDEMGQELLEWQYRHMWDYTRTPWFPAVRLLGYWYKGTAWATPVAQPRNDPEAAHRKAFRMADLMREVGGDTYHRDWGWWDVAGDWNGPNWREANDFLRLHEMGLLLYAPLYNIEAASRPAREHPEWMISGSVLDQSQPAVVDSEVAVLERFYRDWGAFQWRNDGYCQAPRDGDDTSLLAQQQGFFEVIGRFLSNHPDCAMHGVNGGGFALNWEYLQYTSGFQFTDGQAVETAGHYATYLFPPDKINNMPDIWDPEKYDPATWRGLLCTNIDFTGDTFEAAKLRGIREIIAIYHYLGSKGVAGRWVRVYHPTVEGDSPTMVLQRLSWDRKRGVLVTKHKIDGEALIRPKGLVPTLEYEVSYQDDLRVYRATGRRLMADGIRLTKPAPGELVYLNLTDHPGHPSASAPVRRPSRLVVHEERHMGVAGVMVTWQPARTGQPPLWYEVMRDGELIGRAATGRCLFDHSAGADPAARYSVVAVGRAITNRSSALVRPAPAGRTRRSVNDAADPTRVALSTGWEVQAFAPAHAANLVTSTQAGASASLKFVGRRLVVHGRLGAEGGRARVLVDGAEVGVIDCYAADELPGWPMYEQKWEATGPHTVLVEVIGSHDPRSRGNRVWLDAFTVDP